MDWETTVTFHGKIYVVKGRKTLVRVELGVENFGKLVL